MGRIAAKALSARQVDTESRPGYYADGPNTGLYLQVTSGATGVTRSWIYRYTSPTVRKRREIGLGSVKVRKLADARVKAAELRQTVLEGKDPKDERDRTQAERIASRSRQITFEQACASCIEAKAPEWTNSKHAQQWTNTLTTYAYPALGKLTVELITTQNVYDVLKPIWLKKTETATRVRQRIEVVLDWCQARGYRNGDNPARLKGALGELLPKSNKIKKVEHHAAVPYQRAHEFLMALREHKGVAPLALEVLMLTAARTGEVIGAQWHEFDLTAKVWTIPADRMKAGKEHRVPLCSRVVEILQELSKTKQNEWVFPGHSVKAQKHLSTGAFQAILKKMPEFSEFTAHGLRATFRDWASETTNVANETLELALAHTIKNQAEAAYRRGDQLEKRAKLMQQWQVYVETRPKAAVDVVQMLGHRR